MTSPATQDAPRDQVSSCDVAARKLIRGSSLLLAGRIIAIVLNFVGQVITVRCLLRADYGAFAYGISIASMGASIAVFGLGRALNRFAPMFHERREFGRMAGAIVLAIGCVTGIGIGVVLLVVGVGGCIGSTLIHDPRTVSLLMILILLTPLRALDSIFEEIFAALANSRALFFRRHLVGPLLKLAALLPMLMFGSDARVLAVAYIGGGILGTCCSAVVLWSLLKQANLLKYFRRDKIEVPTRQMLGFSFGLLSADLLVIVRTSLVTLMLEFHTGALGVAAFRAVLPVAELNTFVAESFRMLFSPVISRLFARGEASSIDRVFCRTMSWIAVATFPLFLSCICLTDFLTVTLFGDDYANSASILRLLSVGFYVSAVVSFNYEVLKAHGHIGRMFLTDFLTVIVAILLNLWLVPRWGAMGGAAATVAVLLMRPLGNQVSIFRLGLLREIDWGCLRLFLVMSQVTVVAWLLPSIVGNSLANQFVTTIVGSMVVVITGLPILDIQTTFPELLRLRPVRRLLQTKGV